jgi:hypothetical protein
VFIPTATCICFKNSFRGHLSGLASAQLQFARIQLIKRHQCGFLSVNWSEMLGLHQEDRTPEELQSKNGHLCCAVFEQLPTMFGGKKPARADSTLRFGESLQ